MAAVRIIGSQSLVVTSVRKESSDRDAKIVEVEGPHRLLEDEPAAAWCPSGYVVESSSVASTGDGMGKMTIRAVKYNEGMTFNAEKVTFRIDMAETQYDLKDHPHLSSDKDIIIKWLATEESKRKIGNKYYYAQADAQGNITYTEIVSNDHPFAMKFINAFYANITTFVRYFPVIEKISTYKNPPGLSRNGKSFTGGSPTFSANMGHFEAPPLTLNGYAAANWFKSKDSWIENADTTWTRTEQWTYTPESSGGTNAWVYNTL